MRVQESDIRLSSSHERETRQEVEIQGTASFGTLFKEISAAGDDGGESDKERIQRLLQSLVDAILAAVNGKKCRSEFADFTDLQEQAHQSPGGRKIEWQWQKTEKISEHEQTRVEGCGVIKTADGASIDFSFGLNMCRDYSQESLYQDGGSVVLHDPLVLSFDGKAAELAEERFAFDLDADGQTERIHGLGSGSGYLVLDRNGNGRVDDGSELFGTRTGNGFAELEELDNDGNGWIDEGDAIFGDLRIWRGGDSATELSTLGEQGVGALWLGSVQSPFALTDSANRLLGEIRASGIYLAESGQVGALQQVDLVSEPHRERATDGAQL